MENTNNNNNMNSGSMDNKSNGGMGGKKWGMGTMNSCGCGSGSGWGAFHIVRRILMLIFIIIIFWSGFKLGEIVGSVHGYGRGGMMGRHYGMMDNYDYSDNSAPAAGGVTPAPAQ